MPRDIPPQAASRTNPTAAEYARGALYGVSAVSIWAGWIVIARLGLESTFTPWDIVALRFIIAGLILLPYLLRKGLALDRLGAGGLAAVVIGGGAPIILLANAGLLFAPTAHAGALFPGVMPLMVMLLAAVILGEAITAAKGVGFALILAGALGIVGAAGGQLGTAQNIGHAMFVGSAFLWACYTVAMRRARLDGLHAAAIAAVGSLFLYLPVYFAMAGTRILAAPPVEIALQGFVQGILTAILSLLLYGRAVAILGASSGAAFAALCPVMTALLGIAILGELPSATDWLSIAPISLGVYFVSGGPLPWATRPGSPPSARSAG